MLIDTKLPNNASQETDIGYLQGKTGWEITQKGVETIFENNAVPLSSFVDGSPPKYAPGG